MKKILLLTALLFSLLLQAQDAGYLNKIKNIYSEADVIAITNEAMLSANMRLHKSKDFGEHHMFVIQYVPVDVTDEQIEKDKAKFSDQFAIFQFRYYNEGENKDLKIEGKKKYIFSDLRGEYLTLFNWWKKYFNPAADIVKVSEKHNDNIAKYYFAGTNNKWKIQG